MIDAPHDELGGHFEEKSGYLEQMADYFAQVTGYLFSSLATEPTYSSSRGATSTSMMAPYSVDPAMPGQMSMYSFPQEGKLGVHYQQRSVSDSELLAWCTDIVNSEQPTHARIVERLVEPFNANRSSNSKDAWLSADVIVAYLQTLQNHKIQYIEPGYYQNQEFLRMLSTRVQLSKKLRSANKIFWPVCEGDHWYIMLLEKLNSNDQYRVMVLDSFNNGSKHAEIAEKGRQLLGQLYAKQHYSIVEQEHFSYWVPKQDNDIDCGVAACYYAFKSANGQSLSCYQDFSHNECSYTQFRLHMTQKIAEALRIPARTYLPVKQNVVTSSSTLNPEPKKVKRPGIRVH